MIKKEDLMPFVNIPVSEGVHKALIKRSKDFKKQNGYGESMQRFIAETTIDRLKTEGYL